MLEGLSDLEFRTVTVTAKNTIDFRELHDQIAALYAEEDA